MKETKQNSVTKFSPKREEYTISEKGTLIIPEKVLDKIDYLHKKIGNIEWSAVLFHTKESGDIDDPKNFVLKAQDLYLLDIGNATYTSHTFTAHTLCDMFENVEGAEDMIRSGIHTHHNMQAFFSGTDMQELHDNTECYDYYLSLIVNNDGKWVAKVSYIGEVEQTIKYRNRKPSITTEEALVMIDMNIIKGERVINIDDFFKKRYEDVKKEKESKPKYIHNGNRNYNQGNLFKEEPWNLNLNNYRTNHVDYKESQDFEDWDEFMDLSGYNHKASDSKENERMIIEWLKEGLQHIPKKYYVEYTKNPTLGNLIKTYNDNFSPLDNGAKWAKMWKTLSNGVNKHFLKLDRSETVGVISYYMEMYESFYAICVDLTIIADEAINSKNVL